MTEFYDFLLITKDPFRTISLFLFYETYVYKNDFLY